MSTAVKLFEALFPGILIGLIGLTIEFFLSYKKLPRPDKKKSRPGYHYTPGNPDDAI